GRRRGLLPPPRNRHARRTGDRGGDGAGAVVARPGRGPRAQGRPRPRLRQCPARSDPGREDQPPGGAVPPEREGVFGKARLGAVGSASADRLFRPPRTLASIRYSPISIAFSSSPANAGRPAVRPSQQQSHVRSYTARVTHLPNVL